MTAANQYATRPKDERFPNVEALIANAMHDKTYSQEVSYNLKDLRAVTVQGTIGNPTESTPNHDRLMLASPRAQAELTHWSFGQLARTIGAPANYLRSLPPHIAADCINHGLQSSPAGTTANMLVKKNGGTPIIRACTSDTYDRVWDAPLYDSVRQEIMQNGKWTTPPTWSGEPAGAYRGDRDSFLIVVDGGSIVSDPTLRNDRSTPSSGGNGPTDGMFRGIMVRNSEVGAAAVWLERVYFRFICGNHIIWGAVIDKTFRRRHVGTNTLRDTIRAVSQTAYEWTNASAARDESIIQGLIRNELATTKEAVIDELRKVGFSKEQATEAYNACERNENASPRSYWGLAQGATRISQGDGFQDERLSLDQLAGKLLAIGAAKISAAVRV